MFLNNRIKGVNQTLQGYKSDIFHFPSQGTLLNYPNDDSPSYKEALIQELPEVAKEETQMTRSSQIALKDHIFSGPP